MHGCAPALHARTRTCSQVAHLGGGLSLSALLLALVVAMAVVYYTQQYEPAGAAGGGGGAGARKAKLRSTDFVD
jgi:hypothetical protein